MTEPSLAAKRAAEWWGERLESGDREVFEEKLAVLIEEKLAEWGKVWLTCRDAPDSILLQALLQSGFNIRRGMFSAMGILPMGTHLKVTPDRLYPEDMNGQLRIIRIPVA